MRKQSGSASFQASARSSAETDGPLPRERLDVDGAGSMRPSSEMAKPLQERFGPGGFVSGPIR
ncbi:hypothetical protein WT98_13080 [Burkholderia territorii]|nr:hypothetical protein WT98_13080 [Burkholderia territorii]